MTDDGRVYYWNEATDATRWGVQLVDLVSDTQAHLVALADADRHRRLRLCLRIGASHRLQRALRHWWTVGTRNVVPRLARLLDDWWSVRRRLADAEAETDRWAQRLANANVALAEEHLARLRERTRVRVDAHERNGAAGAP